MPGEERRFFFFLHIASSHVIYELMYQMLTIKLPVITNQHSHDILVQTIIQYKNSFNRVSQAGWDMPRLNGVELHHLTYYHEREITDLPSQLIISARMKATEALKASFTKKKKGELSTCPYSKHGSIRYDHRSSSINLLNSSATLASISGRQSVTLIIPKCYSNKINGEICSADLCQRADGRLFLHVVIKYKIPEVIPQNIIGIDLGVNRPAVTSENLFFGQRRWKNIEHKYFNLRKALQAKGTKSAKKHLKKIGRKVNRFRNDCDHVLSKNIIQSAGHQTIVVLEDLTDIRTRMKGKKAQKRRLHSWSFHRLQFYLEYKGNLNEVLVEYIDPRYTSQKCSKCGHIEKGNRKTQSSFVCKKCGFQHNADLNAAKNIRNNYLASKGISLRSRLSVNQPIVAEKIPF